VLPAYRAVLAKAIEAVRQRKKLSELDGDCTCDDSIGIRFRAAHARYQEPR